LAEEEGTVLECRQGGVVAGLGEISAGPAAVRLEAALAAIQFGNDRLAIAVHSQGTLPAVGPGPSPAERALVIAADDVAGENAAERDRQARRVHADVVDGGQARQRAEADGLLYLEGPKLLDI